MHKKVNIHASCHEGCFDLGSYLWTTHSLYINWQMSFNDTDGDTSDEATEAAYHFQ